MAAGGWPPGPACCERPPPAATVIATPIGARGPWCRRAPRRSFRSSSCGRGIPRLVSSPRASTVRVRRTTGHLLLTHAWKAVLVVAVAGGGLWTATHRVAGVAWTDVAGVLQQVAPDRLVLLAAIWLGGLGVYTLV